jgi:phenylacetate-CoA ligase
MTEMGFGAAMSCAAQDGYHLREADLLFEIIDPVSGKPLPNGHMGEVVFTTLNHQAMPLIRYRTGDLAAIINRPCPCGSKLRRMAWVQGRKKERILLKNNAVLEIQSLDEALFALPQVVNFKVRLQNGPCGDRLQITLFTAGPAPEIHVRAYECLARIPAVNAAMAAGTLMLDPMLSEQGMGGADAVVKRKIIDNRSGDGSTAVQW